MKEDASRNQRGGSDGRHAPANSTAEWNREQRGGLGTGQGEVRNCCGRGDTHTPDTDGWAGRDTAALPARHTDLVNFPWRG